MTETLEHPPPTWPPVWARKIRDFAAQVVPAGFTGKVIVNFNEGKDPKVNLESWSK